LPTPNSVAANNNEVALGIRMARALVDAWQTCDVQQLVNPSNK